MTEIALPHSFNNPSPRTAFLPSQSSRPDGAADLARASLAHNAEVTFIQGT